MEDMLKIQVTDDILTISISADDLKFVVNNNSENCFLVTNQSLFLQRFATELGRYQDSNAQERGLTALQDFFDTVAVEVFVNDDGNSAEEKKESKPRIMQDNFGHTRGG